MAATTSGAGVGGVAAVAAGWAGTVVATCNAGAAGVGDPAVTSGACGAVTVVATVVDTVAVGEGSTGAP